MKNIIYSGIFNEILNKDKSIYVDYIKDQIELFSFDYIKEIEGGLKEVCILSKKTKNEYNSLEDINNLNILKESGEQLNCEVILGDRNTKYIFKGFLANLLNISDIDELHKKIRDFDKIRTKIYNNI